MPARASRTVPSAGVPSSVRRPTRLPTRCSRSRRVVVPMSWLPSSRAVRASMPSFWRTCAARASRASAWTARCSSWTTPSSWIRSSSTRSRPWSTASWCARVRSAASRSPSRPRRAWRRARSASGSCPRATRRRGPRASCCSTRWRWRARCTATRSMTCSRATSRSTHLTAPVPTATAWAPGVSSRRSR